MILRQHIEKQLSALVDWARIPIPLAGKLTRVFDVLTMESLNQPGSPPYPGLGGINPDGLPFQWSLCVDDRPPTVRFLCESGVPGTPCESRYRLSLKKLDEICELLEVQPPRWVKEIVLPHVMPCEGSWPSDWLSAVWFAVGSSTESIGLKLYLNLMRDRPVDCWKRIGWTLKHLGRDEALVRLCDLSGEVSGQSWPSGLAVDIRGNGSPGRIKAYFRSGEVDAGWLERWYEAASATEYLSILHQMVGIIDGKPKQIFPAGFFFVSCEFSAGNEISLKTDITVARLGHSDEHISRGVKRVLANLGFDDASYVGGLASIGLWPPPQGDRALQQLVGFGYEPDGTCHVNVYCEPPVPPHAGRSQHR